MTKCTLVDNMRFRHWFILLGHLNIENKEDLTKSKALLTNPEQLQYSVLRSQNDDDGK